MLCKADDGHANKTMSSEYMNRKLLTMMESCFNNVGTYLFCHHFSRQPKVDSMTNVNNTSKLYQMI